MAIKYSVFQTRLQGESQFLGQVILQGTYDREALVERMLSRGTTLTKTDITAVLQLFGSAIEQVCSEGYRVNIDGLIQVTPAIGGTFDGRADTFTAPRNTIYLTAQVSKALNDRIAQSASPERILVDEGRPMLLQVVDAEADTGAVAMVMGNIIAITGKRLKFNLSSDREYMRLVNAQNPDEFVPVTKFQKISDLKLVFRLPKTTFTEGYFEVASSLSTSSVRVGRSALFTMVAA